MRYTLSLTDVADEDLRKLIIAPLVEYNAAQAGPSQSTPLVITIRDAENAVVGGLWGSSGYDWLFIQLLVVPSALRGTGVGTEIMRLAEGEAANRGCRGVWLDTFEFQARGFYERLGFECFGELSDYPKGFSRFFMRKLLRPVEEG